jgi:hypothetical protein
MTPHPGAGGLALNCASPLQRELQRRNDDNRNGEGGNSLRKPPNSVAKF